MREISGAHDEATSLPLLSSRHPLNQVSGASATAAACPRPPGVVWRRFLLSGTVAVSSRLFRAVAAAVSSPAILLPRTA